MDFGAAKAQPGAIPAVVRGVQASMRAKGFLMGRAFPPHTTWCRVDIGTPDEMTAFIAALPESLLV